MSKANRRLLVVTGVAATAALTGGIAVAASPGGHSHSHAGTHSRPAPSPQPSRSLSFGPGPVVPPSAHPSFSPPPRPSGAPTSKPTSAPKPPKGAPPKGMPGGPGGFGGGFGPIGVGGPGVLHGQDVRQTGTNTFQTDDFQTGTVTAVSATSLTVVSADKFSLTYTLTSATKEFSFGPGLTKTSKLADGDRVSVEATVGSGGTVTATFVSNQGTKPVPSATPVAKPSS